MINVFDVAELFIEHTKKIHPDKIGIIAYYGSYSTGTATSESDLDLVYIPDDIKTTLNLYNSFILEGRSYEFWPISWKRLERIANADEHWAVAASLLMNMKVLYSRSDEDLKRFKGLLEKNRELMTKEKESIMVKKALKEFNQVLNNLGKLELEFEKKHMPGIHWAAWQVITSCTECLALINQQFFNNGWGKNHEEILSLKKRPQKMDEYVRLIITSYDPFEIKATVKKLAFETREILLRAQKEIAKPVGIMNEFRDYFPGVIEYTGKVKKDNISNMPIAANYDATKIQAEFNFMLSKGINGYGDDELNLYSEVYDIYKNFSLPDIINQVDPDVLLLKIEEFSNRIKELFNEYGVNLNQVESLPELSRFFKDRV